MNARRNLVQNLHIPGYTTDPRVLYHAGMICYLRGDVATARDLFQRALFDPFQLTDHELGNVHEALLLTADLGDGAGAGFGMVNPSR